MSAADDRPFDAYSAVVVGVAEAAHAAGRGAADPRLAGASPRVCRGAQPRGSPASPTPTWSATRPSGEAAFADGTTAAFEVVGSDPLSDLAVVRTDRAVPSPPAYGDADSLKVGSLVVAVGNPSAWPAA